MKPFLRLTLLIALLLAGLSVPGATSAQEPPPDCSPAMLAAAFASIQDHLTQAQAYLSDNNEARALDSFKAAAALMDEVRVACGIGTVAGGVGGPSVGADVRLSPVEISQKLCETFPSYCVPFMAGGLSVDGYPSESPGVRPMLGGSLNTPVVRGLTAEGGFFLGDPNAPIHFLEYLDFACPHCVAYDNTAIKPFIEQAVSAGQASYEVRLMQFVAGELSANAAYAMLCAGEQGAAWELREALFAAYDVQQAQAYTTENIAQTAYSLALDPNVLSECMQSARYALHMANFAQSFNDLGLTGTPSMLVSYGSGREWTKLEDRGLENLLKLVAAAQR